MLPSLENLRCFREAARLLNFRAAARSVALTPAAMSNRIAQLEDQLGVRLFTRTTRQVSLTREGTALLPHAERTLAAAGDCLRVKDGAFSEPPLELTVGTRHELGLSWLVPMRGLLARARPALTLHFYFGSGDDLSHRVRGRLVDCAVTSTRIGDPRLDSIRLHEERYAFVASPGLLARQPVRHLRDVAQHTLIDISDELPLFRYLRDAPGPAAELRFLAVRHLGTIAAIRELVLAGEGVAVLPVYFIAAALRERKLVPVLRRLVPAADYFRLVFRNDDGRRPLYTELATLMRRQPLR